ncbi:MAG: DUF3108 domain-containing protein [Gammaproteobacteria bacterium]|nr:DUF3108 domain-containing protein [Gammaproteobacteria bacterium]
MTSFGVYQYQASGLLVAALLLFSTSMQADEPQPFSVTYKVYRSGFEVGTTRYKLMRDAEFYIYDAKARPAGIAVVLGLDKAMEITRLQQQNGQLRPMQYEYSIEGEDQSRRQISFDWEQMVATVIKPDKTRTIRLTPDTLTPLAMQLVVMQDMQVGQLKPSYTVIGNKRLEHYRVRKLGTEPVVTGIGRLQTVLIEGSHTRKGVTRTMRLWCAPDLAYLPVKVEQDRDESSFTLELVAVEGLGK